jgi:catechol 2,3-dioxygenase-like lactoylglutathione lyase family enzyme
MPGVTIDELLIADEPERWAALGFSVADGACELGGVRLAFTAPGPERGIIGWSLRGAASTELDGLDTTVSARPLPPAAPEHPNGVVAIDHVVAITPELDRSVGALRAAGLDLRRVREQPTQAGAPRQAFFRLGEEILELVAEPEQVIERAGGANRPAHFWGLALLVRDLERTVGELGGHAGAIRPAVQPGRQIATVRRSAGVSIPLALMSLPDRSREP